MKHNYQKKTYKCSTCGKSHFDPRKAMVCCEDDEEYERIISEEMDE